MPRSLSLALLVLGAFSLAGCDRVLAGLRAKKDAGAATTATATNDDDRQAPPSAPALTTATPGRPTAPAPKPASAPALGPAPKPGTDPASLEAAFAVLDANKDGKLTGAELQRCACSTSDRDKNGDVTKAEYLADGLMGKLASQQGSAPAPGPAPAPAPGPAPPPGPASGPGPAPAPVAGGGLPAGTYNCFGLVGSMYAARGSFTITDGAHYNIGGDPGTYVFDPATKKIRWTSGLYSDPAKVKDSWQVSAKQISMKTGKDGFYQWDCER